MQLGTGCGNKVPDRPLQVADIVNLFQRPERDATSGFKELDLQRMTTHEASPYTAQEKAERRPARTIAELLSTFDWSATELGPRESWPEALAASVRMVLAARIPMCLLIGQEGNLIYNDGYAQIAGSRHPEIFGMAATDAWPEIADFNRSVIGRVMSGECVDFRDTHFSLARNGRPEDVWLDIRYSPITDAEGRRLAALAILNETTDRKITQAELARSVERLDFAMLASGGVGYWDWDVVNDRVTAGGNFADMFGVDRKVAEAGTPIAAFLDGVHPDDRDVLAATIQYALNDGNSFQSEYRLNGAEPRWVLAIGRAVLDDQGAPIRLPGVAIDITDRKKQEQALATSEAGFRALADSMPQMVWSTRPDGFHDYYNARWYEFTGVPAGSTDGEGWNGMFHPDDQNLAWTLWRHSLTTGEPYQIEYRLRHHSGEYRWTLGRALPVRDEQGRITRWFGTCTDIHDSKRAAEEREVVAQELSHRIKNIFSVLTGIIALSARSYPGMKPFADQLRSRISAMGRAHDFVRPHSRVSRPAGNQSSLRALIEQLVMPFQTVDQQRIVFSGDDAALDDAAATPIALLVHELATNAAKYGALAVQEGRVTIDGQADGDSYELTWRERGGEPIDGPPAIEGFGSRLISLSIEGQLGGSLERRWEPEGLMVVFSVPLAALNRSSRLRRPG
ncbi:MAG: PAS domain-containing protein [Rhizobiaceae bacterium]|nr:PAS domain-containing protein [Rhizobiaceae bacterium]